MMSSRTGNPPPSPHLLAFALVFAVIVPQIGVGISVPALPEIARVFGVSISMAQGTLIVYMAGYAVSMLIAVMQLDLGSLAGLCLLILSSLIRLMGKGWVSRRSSARLRAAGWQRVQRLFWKKVRRQRLFCRQRLLYKMSAFQVLLA